MAPDARIAGVIRLLFDKFKELGSARQVLLWAQDQGLQLPITRLNNSSVCKIDWRRAAYHTMLTILVLQLHFLFMHPVMRLCCFGLMAPSPL